MLLSLVLSWIMDLHHPHHCGRDACDASCGDGDCPCDHDGHRRRHMRRLATPSPLPPLPIQRPLGRMSKFFCRELNLTSQLVY